MLRRLLSRAWKKRLLLTLLVFLWVVAFQVLFYDHLNSTQLLTGTSKQHIILAQSVEVDVKFAGISKQQTEQLRSDEGERKATPVATKHEDVGEQFAYDSNSKQQNVFARSIVYCLDGAVGIIDSRQGEGVELNEDSRYAFFVPHVTDARTCTDVFSKNDQHSMRHIVQFLETYQDYDAATCFMASKKPFLLRQVNDTWCRFSWRESTLIIRDTGRWLENNSFPNGPFQSCSIVKGPFLMRKETFRRLGWKSRFGRASIFDFFLRSEGKLKIARLSDCVLSDNLGIIDRGTEEGTHDFPDYSQFANEHGILRIVMEDRIEWTKCVADSKLCSEKPFIAPKTLPQAGMPLCCSYALDRMLRDMVWAIKKVGLSHRVIYGTLLGAIRSKAIIPWTHDVDIALNKSVLAMVNWSEGLQTVLQGTYFIGISFMGAPRAIPLIPVHIDVNTTSFFNGLDDLSGENFFSEDILRVMTTAHVIGNSWRERGYVDFYEAPEIWWNGSSIITINEEKYISIRDIDYELANWYGKDYMKPVLSGSWTGLSDTGS